MAGPPGGGETSSALFVPSAQELGRAVRTDIACPVPRCGRALPNEPALRMHLSKAHGMAEEPQLTDRSSRSSDGRPRLYCCPVEGCPRGPGRPFSQFSLVRQHYLKMHAERTHECGTCERRYSTRADLRRHQGDCGRVFSCSCGCPYASRTALLSHAYRTGHTLPEEHRLPPGRKRKLERQSSVQTPMRVVSVTQQPDASTSDSTHAAPDPAPPQQRPPATADKCSPKTPAACPSAPNSSPVRATLQDLPVAAEQAPTTGLLRARERCTAQHAVRAKGVSSKLKCEGDDAPPVPLSPLAPSSALLRAPSKRLLLPKPSAVLLKLSVTQQGAAALLSHREGSSIKPVVVAVDEAGAIVSTLALVHGVFGSASSKGSREVSDHLGKDGFQPASTVACASPKVMTGEGQAEPCVSGTCGVANSCPSATNAYVQPLNFLVSTNAQTDVSFSAVGSTPISVCTQTQCSSQRTTSSFAVQTESWQDQQIQINKVAAKHFSATVGSWDPNGRKISIDAKLSGSTGDISTACDVGGFVGENNSTAPGLLKAPSVYDVLPSTALLRQSLALNQLGSLESIFCDRAITPESTNRDPGQVRAGSASGVDMETHTHDFELYLERLLSGAALPSHPRDRGIDCVAPGTLDTSAQTDTLLGDSISTAHESTRVDGATQTSTILEDDFNMEMFDNYTQTDLEVLFQDSSLAFPTVRTGFAGNCTELLDTQTQTDLSNFLQNASRLPESQMDFACSSALNTETQTNLFLQRGSSVACPDPIGLKDEMLAHSSSVCTDMHRDPSFSTEDSTREQAMRLDFTSSCMPLHIQTQTKVGAQQEQVTNIPELSEPALNFSAEPGSLHGLTRASNGSRAPFSSAETQTPRNDLDDFFFTSIETQTMEDDFLLSDLDFGGMETPFGSIDAQTSPGYGSSAESEESHAGSRTSGKADVPSIFQHFHF